MKKRLFLISVFLLSFFVSCKKDDTALQFASNDGTGLIENIQIGNIEDCKGIDPNPAFQSVASQYGDYYDFNSAISATTVIPNYSFVYLMVAPSLFAYDDWLTVVVNNSASIIGLYEIEFWLNKEQIDSSDLMNEKYGQSYPFYVYDLNISGWLFHGTAYTNYYTYLNNWLTIDNQFVFPTNYPYPLFDNITAGDYSLEGYSSSNIGITQQADVALRIASTFYANFY